MKFQSLCIALVSATAVLGAVSQDGSCGGRRAVTCLNSEFGNCCSQHGYCGSSIAYCGTGCNPQFGKCNNVQSSSSSTKRTSTSTRPTSSSTKRTTTSTRSTSSAVPSATPLKKSTNGTCGKGVTCAGSGFGNCCSEHGYCGSSKEYCNSGCQSAFGTCTNMAVGDVSTNGMCGGASGFTCLGSAFGDCCSQYGYCGSAKAYCEGTCQPQFGKCSGQSSTSRIASATSKTSSSSSSIAVSSSSSSVVLTSSSIETSSSSVPEISSSSTEAPSSSSIEVNLSSTISSTSSFSTSSAEVTSSVSIEPTSSTEPASTSTTEPAPAVCPTSVLVNGGFENNSVGWKIQLKSGQPTVYIRNDAAAADSGIRWVDIISPRAVTSIVTITNTVTGLKSGMKVHCAGRFAGSGLESADVSMTIGGQNCGGGVVKGNDAWADIPTSYGWVTLETDDPPLVVQATVYGDKNLAGTTATLKLDNFDVQVDCSPPPSSTAAPVASTTSSEVASSTSSARPLPTCGTNYLGNPGFDNGSLYPKWTQTVVSGTGSNSLIGGQNPDSYPFHYEFKVPGPNNGPHVTLTQTLSAIKIGTTLSCRGKYKYIADAVYQYTGVTVEIFIDGQWCGYASSYGPLGVEGPGSEPSTGWVDVKPYPENTGVTVTTDAPVVTVNLFLNAYQVNSPIRVALDTLAVMELEEIGLPAC